MWQSNTSRIIARIIVRTKYSKIVDSCTRYMRIYLHGRFQGRDL